MSAKVHVILPVHNRVATSLSFVQSLQRQNADINLILVDDGSADDTSKEVARIWPDVNIIRGDGNLWWSGSLFQARKFLESAGVDKRDIVYICNDDVLIPDNLVQNALSQIQGRSKVVVGVVATSRETGQICDPGIKFISKGFRFELACSKKEINCFSTRSLFMRADEFLNCGGLFPKLLPHYYSDFVFTLLLHRKGYELELLENASIAMSEMSSGVEPRYNGSYWHLLKKVFSNLNRANPLHTSIAIVICCDGLDRLKCQIIAVRWMLSPFKKAIIGYRKQTSEASPPKL